MQHLQAKFEQFVQRFIEANNDRLKDFYLLEPFKYFDLIYLKRNMEDVNLLEGMQNKVPSLLRELKLEYEISDVLAEFPYLFDFIRSSYSENENHSLMYKELTAYFGNTFALLSVKLITIHRLLPLTSVGCDWTFSEQNQTKTKFRVLMGDENLSALICISMSIGEVCKSDLIRKSVIWWKNEKERSFLKIILYKAIR